MTTLDWVIVGTIGNSVAIIILGVRLMRVEQRDDEDQASH